ncbi:hypothetical protein F383_37799 [Gossypium arboreum]|uniref:Uncharacterized protein n=1 Tax=Gossypium arboreum TaxID=29729 RepID=A0A0B0MI22_GOSAR|nr:hypothetical protein F383_37799 [Gossypium arboreum]
MFNQEILHFSTFY